MPYKSTKKTIKFYLSKDSFLGLIIFVLFLFFPLIENHLSLKFVLPIFFIFCVLIGAQFKIPKVYFLLLPIFYFFLVHNIVAFGGVNMGAVLSFPFYWFLGFVLVMQHVKVDKIILVFLMLVILFAFVLFINTFNGTISSVFMIINKCLYQFQMIPLIIIGYFLAKNYDINIVLNFVFRVMGILAIVFLLTYYFDWNYSYSHAKVGMWEYRLTGFERNPNFIASLFLPFIGLGIFIKEKTKVQWVLLMVGVWVFYLTDSRSNLMALCIALFLITFFIKQYRAMFFKIIRSRFYIILVLIVGLIIVFSVSDTRFVQDVLKLIKEGKIVQNERFLIWPQYIDQWKLKPLFGYGLITELHAWGGRAGVAVKYIDSNYLQALVRFGAIGFVLVFLPYLIYLQLTLNIYRRNLELIVPITFILFSILGHLIFGGFTFSENLPPMQISVVLIGMLLYHKNNNQKLLNT